MKHQRSYRAESRRRCASRSGWMRYGLAIVVAVGFAAGLSLVTSRTAWADAPETAIAVSVQLTDGEVTANRGEALSIYEKEYPLATGVTVSDDNGKQREVKDFAPGTYVKYHLKSGKIDILVLMLPK